ncbi:MAG TPA: hypothetical protein VK666_23640 [Chryseolinea sp.]|nr:hypothetical protein [Chryseolinea sp.]
MEKQPFIDLLKNYSKSSEDEALSIIALKESFPFSQVLHILAARLAKDHNIAGHEQILQAAAIYAADRSILKNAMSGDPIVAGVPSRSKESDVTELPPPSGESTTTPVAGAVPLEKESNTPIAVRRKQGAASPVVPIPNGSIAKSEIEKEGASKGSADAEILLPYSVADQVMNDLERLHQLKDDFEALYEARQIANSQMNAEPLRSDLAIQEDQAAQKSRRERIIELAKALETEAKEPVRDAPETPKAFVVRKRGVIAPTIIDEIVNGKEELEPDSPKQKEQLQMIDQFIKTQPSISNKEKLMSAPEGDLATIKTGEFTDNIVSETLVEILVKQGKKDKAIEVLKKLIWKFPQKKSYFAAQIEDLKK